MHPHTDFFPARSPQDRLDVIPLLHECLTDTAGRMRIVFGELALDREQLRARVAGLQRALEARGLGLGSRIATFLGNSADQVALIYAMTLSGITWIPINTKLRGPGLDYPFEHARPDLVISEPALQPLLQAGAAQRLPLVTLADLVREAGAAPAAELRPEQVAFDHPLCIIYTSGTTGHPKGVIFTHRMMRIAGESVIRVADVQPDDHLLIWEPMCHIGGAQMLMAPLLTPCELHIVPRFSASRFWDQCAAAQATQLHYLGGIIDILMQQPPAAWPARHPLRVLWGAGVGLNRWADTEARFGCALRECYGMTECSSFATLNERGTPGSVGRPLPWLTVELLDQQGQAVAAGELGEIVLSSAVEGAFLPGYLDNPVATAATLREGRLFTGDLARRNADGELFFVGRKTDSMRVRGENVSAWEVERIFNSHPAVHASAAVGVASAIGEQEILLYVQAKPDTALHFAALAAWSADKLASYQRPTFYQAVDAFDLTPSERIRKHLLSRSTADAWKC